MKRQTAWFLIVIIMVLIVMGWIYTLKYSFSKLPATEENNFFSIIKKGIKEAEDVFKEVSSKIKEGPATVGEMSFSTSTTSTEEVLTKEELESLKEKILEYEEKQKGKKEGENN